MELSHEVNTQEEVIYIIYNENTTIEEFRIYYTTLLSYAPERENWELRFSEE